MIYVLDKLLKFSQLKVFDRLLGGVFGLVRGALVCAVLVMIMTAFSWPGELLERSRMAPYLMVTARAVVYLVPEDLRQEFQRQYEQVYERWLDGLDELSPALEEAGRTGEEPEDLPE